MTPSAWSIFKTLASSSSPLLCPPTTVDYPLAIPTVGPLPLCAYLYSPTALGELPGVHWLPNSRMVCLEAVSGLRPHPRCNWPLLPQPLYLPALFDTPPQGDAHVGRRSQIGVQKCLAIPGPIPPLFCQRDLARCSSYVLEA